jgi:hypothetical protein
MDTGLNRYCHLNFDSENDWKLREASTTHYERIVSHVKVHLEKISSWVCAKSPNI